MATIVIEQYPRYLALPIGQEIVFSVSENFIVTNEERVKFIAEVYVSQDVQALGLTETRVATLKTTPNNKGIGMFDLRPIIESYVSPDYLANGADSINPLPSSAEFKNEEFNEFKQFPIHIIDQYSLSNKSGVYFKVYFKIEYLVGNAVVVDTDTTISIEFFGFNGYVSNEDILEGTHGYYGLNLNAMGISPNYLDIIQRSATSSFLSEAPATQYARLTDYGTVAKFNRFNPGDYSFMTAPSGLDNAIGKMEFKLYPDADAGGTQLGSTFTVVNNNANGGAWLGNVNNNFSKTHQLFYGVFPANLTGNPNTQLTTHKDDISSYTVQCLDNYGNALTQLYTINIICNSSFGYEGIRLAWLNKWGAWDYYTFNQKSIRSLTTNKTSYTQLSGTWNESRYTPHGYKRGRKNFRINSLERITLNTDFLNNDNESKWIEGLLNSPDVYIINGYSLDAYESSSTTTGIVNKYVEPVIITTSNITRKTRANDKLLQYTIEVERNKDNNTQAI